jgi:hypothetical protein
MPANLIPKLKPMHKAQIRVALTKIVHEGPERSGFGVCYEMDSRSIPREARRWFYSWSKVVAQEWPEYSGEEEYPVPCTKPARVPKGDDCPARWAYGHLPKWKGSYGSARHRYIAFLLGALVNA